MLSLWIMSDWFLPELPHLFQYDLSHKFLCDIGAAGNSNAYTNTSYRSKFERRKKQEFLLQWKERSLHQWLKLENTHQIYSTNITTLGWYSPQFNAYCWVTTRGSLVLQVFTSKTRVQFLLSVLAIMCVTIIAEVWHTEDRYLIITYSRIWHTVSISVWILRHFKKIANLCF